MLSNAYFLAFRFDAAENEPAKNLQNIAKFCQFCQLNFVIPGRLAEDGGDQPEARAVQGPLRQLLEFHQRRGAGPLSNAMFVLTLSWNFGFFLTSKF